MRKEYIPTSESYRKIKLAYEMNTSIYIYGATGYGKTYLANEFTKDKKTIWLNGESEWDLTGIEGNDDKLCVVIDDVQFVKGKERLEKLIGFIKRKDIWTVVIGRIKTPEWMVRLITEGSLLVIPENDLRYKDKEVERLARAEGLSLSAEEINNITERCCGNIYMIMTVLKGISDKGVYDETLCNEVREIFINHIENNIIPHWDTELQDFMMSICVVNEFTVEMAIIITGDDRALSAIEKAAQNGNFLEQDGDVYRLRPHMQEALRRYSYKVIGREKYLQFLNNAGHYFEMKDDVVNALSMYEQSGNNAGIRSLLIRNGRRHMGDGDFYELRKYYYALKDEDVKYSPILMSALCMLYSVALNQDKSEYWYNVLKKYAKTEKGGKKREADELLVYLDIALPHRGSDNLVELIKRAAGLVLTGGISLPEFSVTSNQPSVMNGGKDFCEWSKHDQLLADTIGKLVEKFLGDFGYGLVHTALCESFFEKGGRDAEVVSLGLFAQMDVDGGGKVEMAFASVGIQVRLNIVKGALKNAYSILEKFELYVKKNNNQSVLGNLRALRCRLDIISGNDEAVDKWLATATDENIEFWALDRYKYFTKVLIYIDRGRNAEAISLLERLKYYSELNKRTYMLIQIGLYQSIILQREGLEWKKVLKESLDKAYEYNFVRIISECGSGILPLLKGIKKEYLEKNNNKSVWFNNVLKETAYVAEKYPGYLICDKLQPSDFSETSLMVLKCQSEGLSIKDIAEKIGMSERTVKYHAAENYKKLGAKGKTDAVQRAKSLNLI